MVRDEQKYEQAVVLRKRGFTLEEIARICEVSKSTVSKWLKNNVISAEITKQNKRRAGKENAKRLQLMSKVRRKERSNRQLETTRAAETEFKHYKKDALFVAGLITYLHSGDIKAINPIRLSSTGKEQHTIFIKFATEYLGVPKNKIKFWILLYSTHNEQACMKKWQKVTGLPYVQFHKNQVIKTSSTKQALHHGVGNTIIGNTALKHKLTRWVELMVKELVL